MGNSQSSRGAVSSSETGGNNVFSLCLEPGGKGICQDTMYATQDLFCDVVLPATMTGSSNKDSNGRGGMHNRTTASSSSSSTTSRASERVKVKLAAIFDGHGTGGHHISQALRDSLPAALQQRLSTALQAASEGGKEGIEGGERGSSSGGIAMGTGIGLSAAEWRGVFESVFASLDEELREKMRFVNNSGSTGVVALQQGSTLVVAHVGDSRCVLGQSSPHSPSPSPTPAITAVQLTVDHKAGHPTERARVEAAGGVVRSLFHGPPRVFLPGRSEPGLAVARAFGDFDLRPFGVVARPDVKVMHLQQQLEGERERDEFLVLASDGVWDVLSNEEVVRLVAEVQGGVRARGVMGRQSGRAAAARAIVGRAMEVWTETKPSFVRDDISAAVLFLTDRRAGTGQSCTACCTA